MEKCLVTKYSEVSGNEALLKVGEICFSTYDASENRNLSIKAEEEVKLRIIGDGYFTDASYTTNLGKEKTISPNVKATVYLSDGEYNVYVSNKYSLNNIELNNNSFAKINLEDIKYSNKLNYLVLDYSNSFGDISSLANTKNLVILSAFKANIKGDISALAGKSNLTNLNLNLTNTSGDISVFVNNRNLQNVTLVNVTGDISNFKKSISLKELALIDSNVYGDLSSIPDSCYFMNITSPQTFNWVSRSESANILSLVGRIRIDNIDKMLQDQAVGKAYTGSISDRKIISVIGTRTSASDAAVATLQGKGYTVSITPA